MTEITERKGFISLRSDFGFKHCMSEEVIMRSFLNAVLSEDYGRIKHIEYVNVEPPKERELHRGVIFDLRCRLDNGGEVIVEITAFSFNPKIKRAVPLPPK